MKTWAVLREDTAAQGVDIFDNPAEAEERAKKRAIGQPGIRFVVYEAIRAAHIPGPVNVTVEEIK